MQLVKFPNIVLKQPAANWDFTVDKSIEGAEIVERSMIAIMQSKNGIGLAANQVGLLYRVFVIKLTDREPFAMFNPRVISAGAELRNGLEGCLSFPELWLDVKRPQTIEVEYFDKLGDQCILTLTDIDSRCFLHELDHLNGVCFTDLVSPLKLSMAKKKQQKRNRNG
jgi:peptide deformylase